MSLLSFVLQAGLKENHPSCNTMHCINRKQKRKQCRVCVDICPQHVYAERQTERPKWSKCENCGLCVSACPTRCIAPSAQNLEAQFALAKPGQAIRIACQSAEEAADFKVPCLAALPWEMLAYLALIRSVTFLVGACAECGKAERVTYVRRELGLLLQFLGEELYLKQVTLEFERKGDEQERNWSRRGLLQAMTAKTARSAEYILAEELSERYEGLFYRQMLADLVRSRRASHPEARYVLELPRFQKNCYGCGSCAKLCPNQALTMGTEKEGRRPIYIIPWRCTGCGVCAEVCRDAGISGIEKIAVPHMDRLLLVEVMSATCQSCGRPIRPGAEQPCVICRQKKRR